MAIGVIVALIMGATAGVAIETNHPAVSDFGDKYLSATNTYEVRTSKSER